jgi:hypothetical protein
MSNNYKEFGIERYDEDNEVILMMSRDDDELIIEAHLEEKEQVEN